MIAFLFGILVGIIVVLALIYNSVKKTQRTIIQLESLYSERFELYAEEMRDARCDARYIRLVLDRIILPGCQKIMDSKTDPQIEERIARFMQCNKDIFGKESK